MFGKKPKEPKQPKDAEQSVEAEELDDPFASIPPPPPGLGNPETRGLLPFLHR